MYVWTKVEMIKGKRGLARRGRMREVCIEQMVFNLSFGEWVEFPVVEGLPDQRNRLIKVSMDGDVEGMGMVQKLTICICCECNQNFKSSLWGRIGYLNLVGSDSWSLWKSRCWHSDQHRSKKNADMVRHVKENPSRGNVQMRWCEQRLKSARAVGGPSKELRKAVVILNGDTDNGDGGMGVDLRNFAEGDAVGLDDSSTQGGN